MNATLRLAAFAALPLLAQSSASAPDAAPSADAGSAPASSPAPAPVTPPVKAEPQPIGAVEVIEIPGKTKADLFAAARTWFVDTFRDSKKVIEVNDEPRGEITAKGLFEFTAPALTCSNGINGTIAYRMTILVKDGKAKIEVTRFIHTGSVSVAMGIKQRSIDFGLITDDKNPPSGLGCLEGANRKDWLAMQTQSRSEANGLLKSAKAALLAARSAQADDF